jgi:mannose-6-phosphate isomerase-like protein (cupin superfamily)
MELKITSWNKADPPTEAELRQSFHQEDLSPYAWSNAPGDFYPVHLHNYNKVLMVVSGSITWILDNGTRQIEAFPGDRIDLPRGTPHAALVGFKGVVCLEAQQD